MHSNAEITEKVVAIIAENIAMTLGYPTRLGMISMSALREQARRLLDAVGGGIDPDTRIFDLPRTERSLLAIARPASADAAAFMKGELPWV